MKHTSIVLLALLLVSGTASAGAPGARAPRALRAFGVSGLLVSAPADAGAPSGQRPSTAPEPVLDVVYARRPGVDPKLLSLDIYRPGSRRPAPVLVFVHGGGWSVGDKRNEGKHQNKIEGFTRAGYVTVLPNYRLSPAVRHPEHANDVAAALAWVHTHIARYGGDPGMILLMGHSAGAHLVSLVGTDGGYLRRAGKAPGILKAVVSLDTDSYDLVARFANGDQGIRQVLQVAFGTDPHVYHDASPINHVKPGLPPFDVVYVVGRSDESAKEFAARLRRARVPLELYGVEDSSHSQLNENLGLAGDAATEQVMAFLEKVREGKLSSATAGAGSPAGPSGPDGHAGKDN